MGAGVGAGIILAILATPAIAAGVLPFDGAFGNAPGCHLYATGEGKGDYQLLTGDTFAARAVACDFQSLVTADGGVFRVSAVCGRGEEAVTITDNGTDGYSVKLVDDLAWGPLKACPPTELQDASGMRS